MAGDWIKMRGNLWDDPRIGRIVDLTNTSEAAVVGGLYWLWATADQHTEDGCLPGLSMRQIDRKTGIPGFAAALVEINWLRDDPQGVVIVSFEEHNGTSAKKRSETARRVAKHRAQDGEAFQDDEDGYQRLGLSRKVRDAVIEKCGGQCVYCGRHEGFVGPMESKADGFMHIDHVVPLSRGGSDTDDNLVAACRKCNMKKSDRTPDECGFAWPVLNGKRAGNTKAVTPALAREEKRREEKEEEQKKVAEPRQSASPPSPPPPFDGLNAEVLNGKSIVNLAPNWELPDDWGEDAEKLGWQPSEVLREAEKFRQYWVAGKGMGKRRNVKGWRQSWSNWLAKAAENRR